MGKVYAKNSKYAENQVGEIQDRVIIGFILLIIIIFGGFGYLLGAKQFGSWIVFSISPFVFYVVYKVSNKYMDKIFAERRAWLKGLEGEELVSELLRFGLSDKHHIFNGIPLSTFGDIDHFVIGPSGLLVIETKNNYGYISSENGNLLLNMKNPPKDPIKQVHRLGMNLREKMKALVDEEVFFKSFIVYPFGHICNSSKFPYVTILNRENLIDHIEKLPRQLSDKQIHKYLKAAKSLLAVAN